MDSRLIYKLSHYSISKVEWLNVTPENGAWIFIGDGDDVRKELVIDSISKHFASEMLYVSWTRNGSMELLKETIEKGIDHLLGVENFLIWDADFNRVIEFNKSGVMRLGLIT